ncbi:phage integrase family protein [Arthrobacter crystallopoietes BAB-32]|uniref:Phage integrase family protein n=1 Tax=Arthrobacter crystallopoietes BAB-32 TaxID=1246476 RepID=N1UZD7_9MICC|nr:tyrosine-type recombinase/integrase [Arthrobacter crystallopoietes]EMY35751.1 phage integrase family protein [Arthrobacter crystallopoietes BAB-32]
MAHIKTLTRANGKAAYEVRWRDGSRFRQRTFTAKREAERFALKVENELAEGTSTEPLVKNSKTFHEVAESCLDADRPRLKQKTLEGYETTFRVHIYPVFGHRRIASITSQEVERFIAELRDKPTPGGKQRSESSVRGTFLALQKVFSYAVRHRLISYSPMEALNKPRLAQYNANFLTLDEANALAAELDSFEPYGLIVRFAVWTGLRSGELGALRIRDIDMMHKEVRVERTMSWVKEGWIFTTPKSERSRRAVPLLDERLIAELREYLAQHPYRTNPDAGLWPGKVKGHPLATYDRAFDPKGFYRYSFKPAAKATGHPTLKFHELRHTFASLMVSFGVSMFELSRLMGHSSITVTDSIYAHMYKKDYSDLRRRIAVVLEQTIHHSA